MSLFGKLFASKKEQPTLSTQDALQKLQETEDMLLKKNDFLELKVKQELETAKSHGTKNKRLALQALKRKKNYEQQILHIDGVLNTIQNQKSSLENASMNSGVLTVMGDAAKALKSAHNKMDIDKVHDLMEDIAEQQEVANEIASVISSSVGLGNDVDEDELLKELEAMEEEELDQKLGMTDDDEVLQLPKVPISDLGIKTGTSSHAKKQKQEDSDLAELEAWANA